MNHNFTEKEMIVLSRLIGCLYAEPGFSDVTVSQIVECGHDLNSHAVRGVLSSLSDKGVVYNDVESGYVCGETGEAIIYLDPSCWRYHKVWAEDESIEYIDIGLNDGEGYDYSNF